MAQPTQSAVHVDRPLTNISVAYIQEQSRFIASTVFPVIPVEKQSDKYFTYTKNDWFRDEAQLRGDATEAAGSGYNLSTDNYTCDVYAMRKDVGDQVVENSDSPIRPFEDATRFVTQKLLLKQEIQWVTDAFADSIWDTNVTGGTNFTKWSDEADSNPIDDVALGMETILQNTGMMPNTLVLGYQVFRQLKQHPDLIDRMKYTGIGAVKPPTTEMLAGLFEVDRVLVASAVKATNVEGATVAYSFTFGKNAGLYYVNPSPGTLAPSAGYTFVWRDVSQGMGLDIGIKRYRIETIAANRVEGQIAWDNKIVGSDLGYMFLSAVA